MQAIWRQHSQNHALTQLEMVHWPDFLVIWPDSLSYLITFW
jgi:hypothetical protein